MYFFRNVLILYFPCSHLQDNYDYSFNRQDDASTRRIMSMLSGALRLEVTQQLVRGVSVKIAFLDAKQPDFVAQMSHSLVRQTFLDGEFVLMQEESCLHEVLFVTDGHLIVTKLPNVPPRGKRHSSIMSRAIDNADNVKRFHCGESENDAKLFVAEDLFATNHPPIAPASVQAEGKVELYSLMRIRFNTTLAMGAFREDALKFLAELCQYGQCTALHLTHERTAMWEEALAGTAGFEFPD